MAMLKALPAITIGTISTSTGVKLGETPFFPGANATLIFSAPPAGAVVLEVQGSPTGVISPDSYTTFDSLVAAEMAGGQVELTNLPT